MTDNVDSHALALNDNALARVNDNALAIVAERARDYAAHADSAATIRAYESDLRDFERFTANIAVEAIPAEPATVALYLTDLAERGRKVSTIRRRGAAITWAHTHRGLQSPMRHPVVDAIMAGIARTKGVAPKRKAALTSELLRKALRPLAGETLRARRDRAIVLLGFSGALRRSEIAALDVDDLTYTAKGLIVLIRRSKTDQSGAGYEIPVAYVQPEAMCAARAVRSWLDAAPATNGPLFRAVNRRDELVDERISDQIVARLVKRLARTAKLDGDFGAHSLRAGFVTSAAERKKPIYEIQRITRHKSQTVLEGYIRRADLFDGDLLGDVMRKR